MQESDSDRLLGDVTFKVPSFPNLENALDTIKQKNFLNPLEKQLFISQKLYELIDQDQSGDFLLPAVVEFIENLHKQNIYLTYNFASFEMWLNHYSDLNFEEQLLIRGKIVGKYIPRNEYQISFPIGGNKVYAGSHFVSAHASPDIDTIVATFWGWMDAFSAKVGKSFHVWNIPDGPPRDYPEIDLLFYSIFGASVFDSLAKFRNSLTLTALDLVNHQGVLKKLPHEFTFDIDHERTKTAVVVVDQLGNYLGDWRHIDVEGVRQVINAFNICLRWIESEVHVNLISMFSRKDLTKTMAQIEIDHLFQKALIETGPAKEFTFRQQKHLQSFLQVVLHIPNGLDTSFGEFLKNLQEQEIISSTSFIRALEDLGGDQLFDQKGNLIENRPVLFTCLQKVVVKLAEIFARLRNYIDTLDISMKIKTDVFHNQPSFLTHRADLEEVKAKMKTYPYLTVNLSSNEGQFFPIGVIYATDTYQEKLGTVTLRDFCNREETKIPSYLEIISVVDHHKSNLTTLSPSRTVIADTQSSNVLVATMAFHMHDRYSHAGMEASQIEEQINAIEKNKDPSSNRILIELLKKKMAVETKKQHYISPNREFIEYMHYLYAIFDDTDLLTKMTAIDVEVVKELLNRLKTLQLKKQVELIHFDDLPKDEHFVKEASKRLLQNEEMYSLYAKVYKAREKVISMELEKCAKGEPSSIFIDTKTQNSCARVGQTKLFQNNVKQYANLSGQLRQFWVDQCHKFFLQQSQIDLYLHMISTVAGAEDLYKGKKAEYTHKDELWVYIPPVESATQHLKLFLNALEHSPHIDPNAIEVELLGDNGQELKQIFKETFVHATFKENNIHLPIAVIYYKAGSMNSRKGQISPYLPKK